MLSQLKKDSDWIHLESEIYLIYLSHVLDAWQVDKISARNIYVFVVSGLGVCKPEAINVYGFPSTRAGPPSPHTSFNPHHQLPPPLPEIA